MTDGASNPSWQEALTGGMLSVGATKLDWFVKAGAKVRRVSVLLELTSGRKMHVDSYGRCQVEVPCVHAAGREIGVDQDGADTMRVQWCPDCGAISKSPIKTQAGPWQFPSKP